MQKLCPTELRYDLSTLRLTRVSKFHIRRTVLGYMIFKGMVYTLFSIILLGEGFLSI